MSSENENYVKSNVYKMNNKELESISGGNSNNMDLSFMNYRVVCDSCKHKFNYTTLFGGKIDTNNIYCPNCQKTGFVNIMSKNIHTSFLKQIVKDEDNYGYSKN